MWWTYNTLTYFWHSLTSLWRSLWYFRQRATNRRGLLNACQKVPKACHATVAFSGPTTPNRSAKFPASKIQDPLNQTRILELQVNAPEQTFITPTPANQTNRQRCRLKLVSVSDFFLKKANLFLLLRCRLTTSNALHYFLNTRVTFYWSWQKKQFFGMKLF